MLRHITSLRKRILNSCRSPRPVPKRARPRAELLEDRTVPSVTGTLDPSFGGGGKVTTDIGLPELGYNVARDVAAYQSDCKAVVVGSTAKGDMMAVRYNTDGSLDATFGIDGKARINFGANDVGYGVAVDSQGRILVAGYSLQSDAICYFVVARLTGTGALDTSFGGDGKLTIDFGGTFNAGFGVAVDAQDRVLVAGYSDQGGATGSDFAVARLTDTGALDAGFGTGGKQTIDFGGMDDAGFGVAVDSQGRVLVTGWSRSSPEATDADLAVARLTGTGALDTSFDGDGRQTIDFGDDDYGGYSVAVDSQGRILVAGYSNQGWGYYGEFAVVARLTDTGALDTSFDGDGRQTIDFGGDRGGDACYGVAVDAQDRVLVAGLAAYENTTGHFVVARLTGTGALDASFGTGGKQSIQFGDSVDYGHSVAVDAQGRVLVAGVSWHREPWSSGFAVARLTDTGALDTSFGGDGKVTTEIIRPTTADEGRGVAVYQSDGKAVVVGTSAGDLVAVRYNTDGSRDTTFGTDGKVRIDFGGTLDVGYGVAVDAQGRVLVAGSSSQGDFAVARLTATGALDTSFDSDGKQMIDFGGADVGQSVAVDSQGRILVAGSSNQGATGYDFAVTRLTSAGALDTSFGGDGRQTIDFGSTSADFGYGVAVDSQGRVLVAGYSYQGEATGYDFAVTRLTSAGALDTSFGTGGKQTIDFGGTSDHGYGMAVDAQDRVLVAGLAEYGVDPVRDFAVARLTDTGALDTSFDGDGRQTISFGSTYNDGYGVAVDAQGRVLVAGSSHQGEILGWDFAVARLTGTGALDTSFGTGGKQTIDFGSTSDHGSGVALDAQGRILVAGSSNEDFALARLLANTPPTADAGGPYTIPEGSSLTLNASGSSDPDGDLLSYSWDVNGDGAFDASVVSPTLDWSQLNALGVTDDGTWNVKVKVDDGSGGMTTSAAVTLTVTNVAPTLRDAAFELEENATAGTFVGQVTGTDPAGAHDPLTYTIVGGSGVGRFEIGALTGAITVAVGSQLDFKSMQSLTLDVRVDDGDGGTDTATVTVNLLNRPSITGTVFVDVDGDGLWDANEPGIHGATIELLRPDGNGGWVTETTAITSGGYYQFEDLNPFTTYRLHEIQPPGVDDGAEYLGHLDGFAAPYGTIVANDVMELSLQRVDARDYVFTELGRQLTSGDTAGIGFWQGQRGQALIAEGGTALAAWLTANFGNVFGDEFVGKDGAYVASFFRNHLFRETSGASAGPAKVDAQFMAVALATFFTSRKLAGDVASAYGFNVTDTGIGTKFVNVGANGAAFGVGNDTDMTIMQLLLATDHLTDNPDQVEGFARIYDRNGNGVIDAEEAALRVMANEVYAFINGSGSIA